MSSPLLGSSLLCFLFSFCQGTDSWLYFPCMFSAQMHVTVQHITHPSRDTEVCVLLVGKGIMAPMKLTSQSLTSAPKTMCNPPSPSLGKLLCPLTPSTPLLVALFGDFEDHRLLPPWGICLCWDGPLSKTASFLLSFFHRTPFRTQFKIYSLSDLIVSQFRPSDFSPSSPTQCIYDFGLN